MEIFGDLDIFDDGKSSIKEHPQKIEKSEDFSNYYPTQREMNWFFTYRSDNDKNTVDCTDHPDKYVQQGLQWRN
jgi:hypothetical protein